MKKDPTIINFGKKLSDLRKANGMTQKQLGDMIGVSKRVIAYHEGETKYPPAHLIVPISQALNITTADELLGVKKVVHTVAPPIICCMAKTKNTRNVF